MIKLSFEIDMLYTPAPIPTSMTPDLIFEAIIAHASKPDEHNLFTAIIVVVYENPAINWAMRAILAPPPGCKVLTTIMSSTILSICVVFSGWLSLQWPKDI